MSSQIPLSLPRLPNLAIQSFNHTPHRNLTNLNLQKPQLSKSRDSLRQRQQELKLLKEGQPDQSMRQKGSFLQCGASVTRWISGHPCKVNSRLPVAPVSGQEVQDSQVPLMATDQLSLTN